MTKLHQLFQSRREYMSELVKLGRLADFPLVLATKEGQLAIKEIGGYFIEELAEAHEKYLSIWETVNLNDEMAKEHQLAFNEEITDCLNFMLEILILANIDESAVMTFMEYTWGDYLPIDGEYDPWVTMFAQVRRINISAGISPNLPAKNRFIVSPNGINMPASRAAGRVIGLDTLELAERLLWQITYCLKLSENLLKHKPWRVSGPQVDFKDYHARIMYAFINLLAYCEAMGCTSDSLYEMFKYKHNILFQRIKEQY